MNLVEKAIQKTAKELDIEEGKVEELFHFFLNNAHKKSKNDEFNKILINNLGTWKLNKKQLDKVIEVSKNSPKNKHFKNIKKKLQWD